MIEMAQSHINKCLWANGHCVESQDRGQYQGQGQGNWEGHWGGAVPSSLYYFRHHLKYHRRGNSSVNPIKHFSMKLGRFKTSVTYLIAVTMSLSQKFSPWRILGWRTMLTWSSMIISVILLDVPVEELVWYSEDLYLETTAFWCVHTWHMSNQS